MGGKKAQPQTLRFLPAQTISRLVFNLRMPDDAVRRILVVALSGGDDATDLPPAEEVIVASILDEIASYDARYKRDVENHRARQKAYKARLKQGLTQGDATGDGVTVADGHLASVTEGDAGDGGTERNGTDVPIIRGTVSPLPPEGGNRVTVTSSRFVPPSVEEASAYFVERGAPAGEAVRFCDFYAAKGWKVGRAPMKDWRAAVRNWLRSSDSFASGRAPEKKWAAPPAQPDPFEYRGPQDPAEIAAAMRAAEAAPVAPQDDELPPEGPAE